MEFVSAILSIVILDLVLAGDNAVVIALAAKNLPDKQRSKAIYIGTAGAIILRIALTAVAVWLLSIPYLQALGGLILIPVAYKLLHQEENSEADIASADNLKKAVKTIIVADAAMSFDNVLAVAGAANGHFPMVVFGLLVSIPIVVYCSKFIGRMMDKYPILVTLGTAVLCWTAGGMIVQDRVLSQVLAKLGIPFIDLIAPSLVVIGVLGLFYFKRFFAEEKLEDAEF